MLPGLHPHQHDITVVAVAHAASTAAAPDSQQVLNLLRARDDHGDDTHLLEQVCRWLDDADRIVAYNGQTFDLPFIAHKAGALAHLDEWQACLLQLMFAVHIAWPRIEIPVIWLNFVGLFSLFAQNLCFFY